MTESITSWMNVWLSADEYCAAYADPSAVESITTEAGVTYDAKPVEGFWSSER
jgi:hypothetical protein